MEKHQQTPQNCSSTPNKVLGGPELREEVKVWKELATSEARLGLMRKMINEQLAFADLQSFGIEFTNKLKSIKLKNKTLYRKVSGTAMKVKLADEQELRRELMKLKVKMKKDLAEKLNGERTRGYRKTISDLNKIARDEKNKVTEKYNKKLAHIRKKQKKEDEHEEDTVPEDMSEYAELIVFKKSKYEELEIPEQEIKVIGDVSLSTEEKQLLKLHPKFSVMEGLKPGGLEAAQEASLAKLRMEKENKNKYQDYTEEERKEDEESEAFNRMIFNPKEKIFDNRKRRVTDLKQCSRITLPKPLSTDEESRLEVRKRTNKELYEQYRMKNTNAKGEQKSNLTKQEKQGLKKLQERINKEEIIIMKTDKSNKFVVTTPDNYAEMGEEHIKKDKEITWKQVRELETVVSSHTLAWDLIWNTGDDHGHNNRVIKSRVTRSGNQATLSLLFKDHKQGNKTRPVASGNESFNLGLSNGISEVLESVAKAIESPYSVISAEDLLARVCKFNTEKRATGAENKDENGENIKPAGLEDSESDILGAPPDMGPQDEEKSEEEKITLVGNDVTALYPSLTAENSARIAKKQILKSKVRFEGFNMDRGRAYLTINKDKIENLDEIEHLLPKRKSKTGVTPTMSSIKKDWDPRQQWIFEKENLTETEERLVIAAVIEVALKIIFKNFSYKFAGKFYHQQDGGPIGVRLTGALAQLVMEDWGSQFRKILEEAGLTVHLLSGYVDDGRIVSTTLKLGMQFQGNKFQYSEETKQLDIDMRNKGESHNQRMARVLQPAMNSVNPDLVFTTESQEDFKNERLPTLDFEMWLTDDEEIKHSYYQKPMKNPLVLMERSGMAYSQKMQILSNELNRRLSNILVGEIPQSEINSKINEYTQELKNSGYSLTQSREIIVSGIRGWRNRIRKRKRQGLPFYRLAETTVETRMRKEILEKENWFKKTDDDDEDDESPAKFRKNNDKSRTTTNTRTSSRRLPRKTGTEKDKISTVMFIPHTVDSGLAKILKEKEEKLKEITGEKVKIVEKAGMKLENILTKNNPWKGQDCGRPNCLLCMTKTLTEKEMKKDCSKRNILYELRCLTCEERIRKKIVESEDDEDEKKRKLKNMKVPRYVGESSRSAYERGFEHLNNLTSLSNKSHMLRHIVEEHPGEKFEDVKWGMFILKYLRTAFERQIEEAVHIQQGVDEGVLLNSKAEYIQSSLPRLVTRMGDREAEIKQFEKEIRIEKEDNERIEEKIRLIRKERNKERLCTEKNIQPRKKLKTEESYISIRTTWGPPSAMGPPKKNAAEEKYDEKDPKKRKLEENITLKNVRRIEDRSFQGSLIKDMEPLIDNRDWEQVLASHKERLEKETLEREKRIEKSEIKEKSWALYKECKNFLEENEKNWEKARKDRELDEKKKERLAIARTKQEKVREKVKLRKLEKEISDGMKKLPTKERNRIEIEEKRKRELEIKETRKNLWKWRGKANKLEKKNDKIDEIEKVNKMEEKLEVINKILKEIEDEKEQNRAKEREKQSKKTAEWRKKVREKDRKENERKEKLEKERKIANSWTMISWITKFIEDHEEEWNLQREKKIEAANKELEEWNKLKRLEKIKVLQAKWKKEKESIVTTQTERTEKDGTENIIPIIPEIKQPKLPEIVPEIIPNIPPEIIPEIFPIYPTKIPPEIPPEITTSPGLIPDNEVTIRGGAVTSPPPPLPPTQYWVRRCHQNMQGQNWERTAN